MMLQWLSTVEWFENNFMKLNQDKRHLLVSGHKHEAVWAKIGETKIRESNKQKLLGVVVDRIRISMNMFLIYVKKLVENSLV